MNLAAQALAVSHDGVPALAGVSLSFPAGSRVCLLGGSLSGKTTLLKCLAGLRPPTSGKVLWDQEDPFALPREQRQALQARVGLVFQTDALFDSLDVLGNVCLPLLNRRATQAEAKARAEEVLAQVGLSHALATRPEFLSGGMKKRVGLARALASRPEVLLADDPLAGLDGGTADQIAQLLWSASEGRTLIFCAPEPPPLPFDRWVVLNAGRVLHDGPPAPELLDAPAEAVA